MKRFIIFLLLSISTLSFSQDDTPEGLVRGRAKLFAAVTKDSAYFSTYKLDSTKLTNAILAELNRVRKLNSTSPAVYMKNPVARKSIMEWAKHCADIHGVGHGGSREYSAEVVTTTSIYRDKSINDLQYAEIAKQSIQHFIDSPKHKAIMLNPKYTSTVIGFGSWNGTISNFGTIIVIGFK